MEEVCGKIRVKVHWESDSFATTPEDYPRLFLRDVFGFDQKVSCERDNTLGVTGLFLRHVFGGICFVSKNEHKICTCVFFSPSTEWLLTAVQQYTLSVLTYSSTFVEERRHEKRYSGTRHMVRNS